MDYVTKSIALTIPEPAIMVLDTVRNLPHVRQAICGGGYPRGLYMQQHMGLSPEMYDMDIFVDIPKAAFQETFMALGRQFGNLIRHHEGTFRENEGLKILAEFPIPKNLQASFSGLESIQVNMGDGLPKANFSHFLQVANLGINQIAVKDPKTAVCTQDFLGGMETRTLAMNPRPDWEYNDWKMTCQKVKSLLNERPEFKGWSTQVVEKPKVATSGDFWKTIADDKTPNR